MSEYKGIKGFQVQTRETDPTPTEIQTGDFYYNSTTGQFKTVNTGGAPIGTWASGGELNNTRWVVSGFAGTQTANILMGGYTPSAPTSKTETYNGTSWTEVNALNQSRRSIAGFGTYTAAIGANGRTTTNVNSVESWDGTNWTEIAETNQTFEERGGLGTQTAGLVNGGQGPYDNKNENWNGSAWTEVGDLNADHANHAALGTTTAALVAGGQPPSGSPLLVELWDGTSWTETTEMNGGRVYGSSCAGTQTDAMINGDSGGPAPDTSVELWNGSSWTEINDIATARGAAGGGGTTTAGIISGGNPPGGGTTDVTEEFTAADFQIKTVTTS